MCTWREIFGIYCPGCGSTRAYHELIVGNVIDAFLYNPFLFVIFVPFTIYVSAVYLKRLVTQKNVPSVMSSKKATWVTMAIFIGIWVLRNIFPLGLVR